MMLMNRIAPWLLVLLVALALPAAAEILEGHVIHVSDGDTITVLNSKHQQLRVRIAAIDAPERQQPFAKRSQEHLSEFVRRQLVVVEWYKKDRYGRLVGTVYVKGVDVGLEQLRAGLAWHFKRYENEQTPEDLARYSAAENDARARRIGLWQDKEPVPPWEWRRLR